MLEEKLEEARLRSSRLRKQLIIGFLAIIGLCGLVLFGLSSLDFSATGKPPETVSKKKDFSEINVEEARKEFKKILRQYKDELEPHLKAANIEQWNQDALAEMDTLEQSAMSHFSNGNHEKALDQVKLLHTKATATLENAREIYKDSFQKATSFFSQDRYDEARMHIDRALLVNSQSSEAVVLEQNIEKLKRILPLLDDAKVARTENDLNKEYGLLRQILQVTPERLQTAERFKFLGQRIRNNQFEANIAEGFDAIKKRQIQKARQHYQKAKKANPKRKELAILLNQITEQEKAHRIQNAMAQAKQGVQQDNWQQAKIYFTKALKDTPDNKVANEGLKRANEILMLQEHMNQYIQNPYRLTDQNVFDAAEKKLTQAQQVSNYSAGIKKQTLQLRELMTILNQPISVTITSDNKTYVLVRGVGKVGTFSEKSIKLKPGNYTFEGMRDGYTSKLLTVLIPYGQENFSIHVICDEPI